MTNAGRFEKMSEALRSGELVADAHFDRVYPADVRAISRTFWTPVRVAQRAAALLGVYEGARVLDVGSGVGKFCIVAGAIGRGKVTGIEQRARLVEIARVAAKELAIPATFIHGDLLDVDWRAYDGFYFYNPFMENVLRPDEQIDRTIELSQNRFFADSFAAFSGLERARKGARVVTYHGLGASMPSSYRLVTSECAGSDLLKVWVKTTDASHDGDAMQTAS